eukprot:1137193-Rhodomonas_salina.1
MSGTDLGYAATSCSSYGTCARVWSLNCTPTSRFSWYKALRQRLFRSTTAMRTPAHECSNLYFCFRWLLILYKREFALGTARPAMLLRTPYTVSATAYAPPTPSPVLTLRMLLRAGE